MLSDIRAHMAEFGEWNRKGAALSEVTAEKEYGVTRDFIVPWLKIFMGEFWDRKFAELVI